MVGEILQAGAAAHVPQWIFCALWAWFIFGVLQADNDDLEPFDKAIFIFSASAVVFGLLFWGGFFN